MRTVILAAGLFPQTPRVLSLLEKADFIACCDGAANACHEAGFAPNIIVGDADSVAPALRELYADRIVCIPEQETNDLTKTFRHCLSLGHREFVILGATGLREDHAVANLALLMDYIDELPAPSLGKVPSITLVSDFGTFYPCRDQLRLNVEVGREVSIFNFGATYLSAKGLEYPLYDFSRLWQGTLNKAVSSEICINARGKFLVYIAEKD